MLRKANVINLIQKDLFVCSRQSRQSKQIESFFADDSNLDSQLLCSRIDLFDDALHEIVSSGNGTVL
jgi:hypothetical protein